jgi:hypothetical protein
MFLTKDLNNILIFSLYQEAIINLTSVFGFGVNSVTLKFLVQSQNGHTQVYS